MTEEEMHLSKKENTTMNRKEVKKTILMILYFPFQFIIQIVFAPIILGIIACKRAENQAFEDVYINENNEMLNLDGPAMTNKRNHWWITRFIGLDCLFND